VAQPEIFARDNGGMPVSVEEAMRKAAVAWLEVPGRGALLSRGRMQPGRGGLLSRGRNDPGHPPYPVWCLWIDDALYVVSGPDEQEAPGLARSAVVQVSARGDHGGLILTWPARVSRVRPDSEQWAAVAPQLAAKRLNGPPAADLIDRWSRSALIMRLAP
jgi:hypothetical protein